MILSVLNEKPMYTAREDQMTSNQNLKKKINYFLQKKKNLNPKLEHGNLDLLGRIQVTSIINVEVTGL